MPCDGAAVQGESYSKTEAGLIQSDQCQQVDIEMFNYDGLTPLHAAVLSHNAVVKELRTLGNLCSYMAKELAQRAHMYVECIKTLLLTGASSGTKEKKWKDVHSAATRPCTLSALCKNHKRQVEAVKLLMRIGADPGARNFENELPCQLVPRGPTGEKVILIPSNKDNNRLSVSCRNM
ncbi:hypothetical protein F7725_009096 [Dissostichus mawsoni]|uniref:NF-kappa-B inhibitor zeta n=1 Tax=Dissostichus mawsoni TaxID=36200 RepID=A0A7J5Z956_DISMA|nr:hypothetical protein F7725_009096 [Dissostichus mawsoni]